MPLTFACVAPHGGELIPALCENGRILERFQIVRSGMRKLSLEMKLARPDTIIIASPHNVRLWKNIGISFYENTTGRLESEKPGPSKYIQLKAKCDVKIGRRLYDLGYSAGLPVVGVNYGTFEGPTSDLAMDWGTLIPLWFFLGRSSPKRRTVSADNPKIVVVTPSREIPLEINAEFGRVIAKLTKSEKKKIAFVASADQAHAHKKSGPYGYHPAAKKYDELVSRAIQDNDLKRLLKIDSRLVKNASPDSLWQLAMLSGIISVVGMNSEFICYDVPTYYGMICAGFTPLR